MSDKIQSDKRCPICGYFIKISEFGVHTCSSCPFRCFGEDFPRIATAMELARVTIQVHECEAPANSVMHDYNRASRRVLQTWREE